MLEGLSDGRGYDCTHAAAGCRGRSSAVTRRAAVCAFISVSMLEMEI